MHVVKFLSQKIALFDIALPKDIDNVLNCNIASFLPPGTRIGQNLTYSFKLKTASHTLTVLKQNFDVIKYFLHEDEVNKFSKNNRCETRSSLSAAQSNAAGGPWVVFLVPSHLVYLSSGGSHTSG